MQIALLAAKHKRLTEWQSALDELVQADNVAKRMQPRLDSYRKLITACWEKGSVAAADIESFADLERELISLDEEARLTVVAKKFRKKPPHAPH